jgi:hypothetical protein
LNISRAGIGVEPLIQETGGVIVTMGRSGCGVSNITLPIAEKYYSAL